MVNGVTLGLVIAFIAMIVAVFGGSILIVYLLFKIGFHADEDDCKCGKGY